MILIIVMHFIEPREVGVEAALVHCLLGLGRAQQIGDFEPMRVVHVEHVHHHTAVQILVLLHTLYLLVCVVGVNRIYLKRLSVFIFTIIICL